ncbi:MAG: GNAT family N-acetyltransferase, partial [Candidatus Weimeria sp.]
MSAVHHLKDLTALYPLYSFRFSRESDKEAVRDCLYESFGTRVEEEGGISWLNGRYLMALDMGKVIAVTGILPEEKSAYLGCEVTFTCVRRAYRRQGLLTSMLLYLLKELYESGYQGEVYCSCWHLAFADKINLHHVMSA